MHSLLDKKALVSAGVFVGPFDMGLALDQCSALVERGVLLSNTDEFADVGFALNDKQYTWKAQLRASRPMCLPSIKTEG